MEQSSINLAYAVYSSSKRNWKRTALLLNSEQLSYGEFASRCARLAEFLKPKLKTGRIGILASRSAEACIAIVSTAWAGGTYVPLGLKLPPDRLVELLEMLNLDALFVDRRGAQLLTPEVLAVAPEMIVAPGDVALRAPNGRPLVTFEAFARPCEPASLPQPEPVSPDHLAYIEFTSGTTGLPKGVMVSVGAVNNYLQVTQGWFGFGPDDRAAETCDITFDLSVHNMFSTWAAGACLCIMTPLEMLSPAAFIRRHQITTWLSVPSVVALMRKNGTLRDGSLTSLRLSLFCGEPLPVVAAETWSRAAPNSVVENIYGPTEATIACLRQSWSEQPRVTEERGIVAIGVPYPRMEAAILDAQHRPVPAGERGEIALAGAQLAEGYFNAPELTASRFPTIDGKRWYLTGDLGVKDGDGVFHHLGRLDNQVKVQGNRVELEEVEAHLRRVTGSDLVAAVPWPVSHGSAEGLVAFSMAVPMTPETILTHLNRTLPAYMVPQRVELVDAMPLNANGKVDRRALAATLGG